MTASLLRIRLIVATLLKQNLYLLLGLVAWPTALSLLLFLAASGHPEWEDAQSILQQELFYGLILIGLGASTALGTEERARRTQQVLGRAASRWEYLLALGLSAYLPFLGYMASWLVEALAISVLLHHRPANLGFLLLSELGAGLLVGATGLACSVVLPQLAAAAVNGLFLTLLLFAGAHDSTGWLVVFSLGGDRLGNDKVFLSLGATVAVTALVTALACLLFDRRDLRGL